MLTIVAAKDRISLDFPYGNFDSFLAVRFSIDLDALSILLKYHLSETHNRFRVDRPCPSGNALNPFSIDTY